MITDRCLKCGSRYYGWSLKQASNQRCDKCEVPLLITEDGNEVFRVNSLLATYKYSTDKRTEGIIVEQKDEAY